MAAPPGAPPPPARSPPAPARSPPAPGPVIRVEYRLY